MTTTFAQSPNQVLLRNISWQTYQDLLKDLEEQSRIRLTYGRGLYTSSSLNRLNLL